jgi:NAD(P)-dependent dehydrogenase (short-subunit alcohol dehydrogenase family)
MRMFENKVVIITGAARGLGKSQALAFAKEGAIVVGIDLGEERPDSFYPLASQEELRRTMEECRELSSNVSLVKFADVSNSSQVKQVMMETAKELEHIDILVNNAGITIGGKLAHEISEAEWDRVLEINLKGAWLCCKYVIPQMIKQESGKIINISSVSGLVAEERYSCYVASKFGLIGFTKTLAIELAQHNINVNCICPGIVATELNDADALSLGMSIEEGRNEFVRGQLFERLIPAGEVAHAVLWLSSDQTKNVTGVVLPIDAGYSTKLL